jgi:hypothetical protein
MDAQRSFAIEQGCIALDNTYIGMLLVVDQFLPDAIAYDQ